MPEQTQRWTCVVRVWQRLGQVQVVSATTRKNGTLPLARSRGDEFHLLARIDAVPVCPVFDQRTESTDPVESVST